ncbi:MAG: hypothetical protein IJP06_04840 [Agathobacter sp.]|nr:hypothetical protein [Agathobacter sp.]
MPNQYYFYHNPGALLRRFFPKQLNTQALIIIWTVVFILNIVAVVLIQNFAIYKITDISKAGLEEYSYFENCQIKEIKVMPYDDMQVDAYRVSYISGAGVEETVYLEEFPVSIFERYRIKTSSEPTSAIFWHGNQIQKLAGVYIACGVVMLGIEFFLYSVFHRLFRE